MHSFIPSISICAVLSSWEWRAWAQARLVHTYRQDCTKGYLHVSEGPVLHSKVSWKVIREMVGVTSRVGRTHRTYHLLEHARVRVLLGHMISKPCL